MTIGIDKLKQAAADMKAATNLVAEEAGNPDIAEERILKTVSKATFRKFAE